MSDNELPDPDAPMTLFPRHKDMTHLLTAVATPTRTHDGKVPEAGLRVYVGLMANWHVYRNESMKQQALALLTSWASTDGLVHFPDHEKVSVKVGDMTYGTDFIAGVDAHTPQSAFNDLDEAWNALDRENGHNFAAKPMAFPQAPELAAAAPKAAVVQTVSMVAVAAPQRSINQLRSDVLSHIGDKKLQAELAKLDGVAGFSINDVYAFQKLTDESKIREVAGALTSPGATPLNIAAIDKPRGR